MKIYTGSFGGSESKSNELKKRDIGIMLSSEVSKKYKDFSCALDNGAYECYRRGFPFSEYRFLSMIEKSWNAGLKLDFVVCPDIVAGGMESYDFSMLWVDKLKPARLAFAVQDGMKFDIVDHEIAKKFTHIFIGGSVDWKWMTAKDWVNVAHKKGLKCHIGKCGTLKNLI